MQIVLTRDHVSVPWGFRLKGGAEYNVPLSILKVNEGSPSHSKLENGDVIVSIGQYPALNLKHEEALNIIRLFDVTLPLAIRRDQSSFTPPQITRQTNTSSLVWRPSAYTEQPVAAPAPVNYAPVSPAEYDPNNYSAYYNYDTFHQQQQQQQQSMMYQQQTEQIPAVNVQALVQAQVPVKSPKSPPYNNSTNNNYQYRHFNFNTSNTNNNNNQYQFFNHNNNNNNYRNPSQPSSPLILQPPPAPPPLPPTGFSNPYPVYTPSKLVNSRINEPQTPPTRTYSVNSGFNLKSPLSFNRPNENRSANAHIPDVLVKALNGPPLSVKPFTYTPGGLDLSHVRESSRVKRYDPANPELNQRAPTPSQAVSPSFQPQPAFDQQFRGQSPLTVNVNTGQEYDNFLTPPHHTKPTMRPFKSTATKPIKPAPSGPPAPGFHITPQEIVRPKKKEETKDLANQSYSFRMLNKWIEESEAKPLEMLKNDPETYTAQPTVLNVKRTDVLIAVEEEEKKQRKLQMLQRAKQDGNANVPSKVFKFIDRKYSTDIFVNENAVSENLAPQVAPQHGPASQRSQESGLHKYKGADIPSKSFKQLQNMTRAAEQSNQQQTTFVAQQQVVQTQQETQVHEQAEAPQPEPEPAAVVAEVVNSVQIEVSAETSSQEASEAAQTVEAESSFVSSAQEVTQETTVNVTQIESTQEQSEAAPPAEQPVESEKPAEQQQIEAQIEAVIETLSQPEPQPEPEPAPQAEPEPAPQPEPEPTPAEPQPAPEPEPQPQEEAPAAEPAPAPEPEPQPPSQIEQTVSSDQAQDKNETSDF